MAVGWTFGIATNASPAFVNLLGYHAAVLGAGNLLSRSGRLTAVYLVRRYRPAAAAAYSSSALRTQECAVLRELC